MLGDMRDGRVTEGRWVTVCPTPPGESSIGEAASAKRTLRPRAGGDGHTGFAGPVLEKRNGDGPEPRRFCRQSGVELKASLKEALHVIGHGSDLGTGFESGLSAAMSAAEEVLHRSGIIHLDAGSDETPPFDQTGGKARQLKVVHINHKEEAQ